MNEPKKADYRDTVFLPKTDFPMRGNLPQKEPEFLARWKGMDLYNHLRKASKGREKFVLHDGPPYANGNIHIGTALNKILKDIVVRSHQMLGYDSPYVPGWDCHGLPIEWKIEEQYRANGKDKDQVPILQFRAECRAFAEEWKETQSQEFQRLGVVGDWAHPYTTMTKKAEAQILREIYKFLDNGLLYKGVKPVMWSVVEKTALAEAEIEYHDHKSITIWVKFPVVKSAQKGLENAAVVIWTTTPWTIPCNRAIACGADIDYALYEVEAVEEGAAAKKGERLIVAKDLAAAFAAQAKIIGFKELIAFKGSDLSKGTNCAHPFRGRTGSEGYFDFDVSIHSGDFVTTEAGTGFVHIAPHGEDDFYFAQKYGIKFDQTLGDDGRYLPNIKGFAGLYVYKPDGKEGEANGAVIKALVEAGMLVSKGKITHSYPHSWRSKAPLICRATPQWFIALDESAKGQKKTLRETALQAIRDTKWYPAVGENRINGMIESRPDWCISRQRAWGVPIALFVNKKTGEVLKDKEVLDNVVRAFDEDGADAWYSRPAQDFLGMHKAEDYQQVFDIVDVWFESGSTHAFCLNQKLGVSEWPELIWPASVYLEGSDQHRGWFHSSLLESCGTMGRAPYDAVVTHGFIVAEDGRKMSKSLGNVVAPQEVIDKLGADILRLWVVAADYTEDLRIGPDILKQTGDLYRRLRNTLRYLLGALDGMSAKEHLPYAEMPELERWVLHRLHELDGMIRVDIKKFDFNHMLTELHNFCAVDLSAFYFDVRKDSLYCDRPDANRRRAARTVMEHLFNYLTVWLASFLCFTAEEAWLMRHGNEGSVHMQVFPDVPKEWRDEKLCAAMKEARLIRSNVTGMIEQRRNQKQIGSSLEAHAIIDMTQAEMNLFGECFKSDKLEKIFSEMCIVSGATLRQSKEIDLDRASASAATMAEIKIASGKKCERCWQVLEEVGKQTHPDLCKRCDDAVHHLRKAAA